MGPDLRGRPRHARRHGDRHGRPCGKAPHRLMWHLRLSTKKLAAQAVLTAAGVSQSRRRRRGHAWRHHVALNQEWRWCQRAEAMTCARGVIRCNCPRLPHEHWRRHAMCHTLRWRMHLLRRIQHRLPSEGLGAILLLCRQPGAASPTAWRQRAWWLGRQGEQGLRRQGPAPCRRPTV